MKFSEIILKNNELAKSLKGVKPYPIALLSNIIINQLNPVFEFALRSQRVNAKCTTGDYDNIVQDSAKFNKHKLVIVFWEAANLVDGFQYRSNLLSEADFHITVTRFKREIDFVIANLESTPLVVFNTFSSLVFNHHYIRQNVFDKICKELNEHLEESLKSNMVLIDTEKIIVKNGVERSVDFRNYYSSKALYTVEFFRAYAEHIKHLVFSVEGKAKKALVFDCDNTLWSGIVGEDGMEGIQMTSASTKGAVYEEVQFLAKELASKGIIIGLNSKNNSDDVDEVIEKHKGMQLSEDEIIIKRVNWENKADNLIAIAKNLNIGLDSLVFVDDSDFEINLINGILPEVVTIKVPAKSSYLYPDTIRQHMNLFHNNTFSKEDASRLKMYKEEQQRNTIKEEFTSIEDYLKSLKLQIGIYMNEKELIPRMTQLIQKTNQFNLTTIRYTEVEISSFVKSPTHLTFAFDVKDKFGEFGITGVAITNIKGEEAEIDTLLMSCRIIGRNVEFKFASEMIHQLKNHGVKRIYANYIRSTKNEQVLNYLDKVGFKLIKESENEKKYSLIINDYREAKLDYINVHYGGESKTNYSSSF
jgi:FkbH-like protein